MGFNSGFKGLKERCWERNRGSTHDVLCWGWQLSHRYANFGKRLFLSGVCRWHTAGY